MDRFEYMRLILKPENGNEIDQLNILGEDGWQIVSSEPETENTWATFLLMRRVPT